MSRRPRLDARLAAGLGLAAAFLLLFGTRAREQYGDSLVYLQSARTGVELFHPHHLGYNAAVRGVAALLAPLGADVATAAQVHNILWALAALAAMAGLVRRLTGSRRAAWGAAAGLLVCLGFWEYATQAQSYVPALSALALAARLAVGNGRRPWTTGRVAGLAGVFVLAVLYHQTCVLFLLPLAVYFALSADPRSRLRLALGGAAALTAVGALYAAAYLAGGGGPNLPGLLRFALQYSYHPSEWGTLRNLTPAGLGYMAFSLLRNVASIGASIQRPAAAIFGLGLAALVLWHVHRIRKRDEARPGRAFLLAWLAIHLAFYLWWAPHDKNNFTVALFPLVALAAWAAHDLSQAAPKPLRGRAAILLLAGSGLLAAGLAAVNYGSFVRPLHLSRGRLYDDAARLNGCLRPGEAVLADFDAMAALKFYFGRPDVLQAEIPPLCFASGEPLPREFARSVRLPRVLPAVHLDPGSRQARISGYGRPDAWILWLEWLFDLERDASGDVVSGRAFEVFDCGGPYVRIGTARVPLAGWAAFLDDLDQSVGTRLGNARLFRAWADAAGVRRRPGP